MCLPEGSEILSYEFDGKQQAETKAINLSLTNLKTVITDLANKAKFVQYRYVQSCQHSVRLALNNVNKMAVR